MKERDERRIRAFELGWQRMAITINMCSRESRRRAAEGQQVSGEIMI